MNENERREMFNLCDMLQGEINRICVSDDPKEILNMMKYAVSNISKLCEIRFNDLFRGKNE